MIRDTPDSELDIEQSSNFFARIKTGKNLSAKLGSLLIE